MAEAAREEVKREAKWKGTDELELGLGSHASSLWSKDRRPTGDTG